MIEKFFNIVPLLKEHELPGRDSWNALIEFIRGIHSTSPFLSLRTRQPTGMYIDLALEGILMATPQFAFGISPAQLGRQTGSLTISGGTVRWPWGSTASVSSATIGRAAGNKAWVTVTSSAASLNTGRSFPAWILNAHTSSLTFNFPVLELVAGSVKTDAGEFNALVPRYHHVGDINITGTPAEWVPGFMDAKQMSRDIINGVETYSEYGDCEEEEQ